jgi:hypothetical protein
MTTRGEGRRAVRMAVVAALIGAACGRSFSANSRATPALRWEVFVTPGVSIVTRDKPAGVRDTLFQAMAATLI